MPTKKELAAELQRHKDAAEILLKVLNSIEKSFQSEHHTGWKGEVLAMRNEARLAVARYKVALKEDPLAE